MRAPCDVCILLKGDHADRDVKHCPACDAMLCDSCRGRFDLRTVAAIKRTAQDALAALSLIPGRT